MAAFLSPEQLVSLAIGKQFKSISFTYTEPVTFYEYMYESSVIARKQGLHTIMVSSGYINEAPLRALIPYLSAANIDLKAFSEKKRKYFRGAIGRHKRDGHGTCHTRQKDDRTAVSLLHST